MLKVKTLNPILSIYIFSTSIFNLGSDLKFIYNYTSPNLSSESVIREKIYEKYLSVTGEKSPGFESGPGAL